MVSTVTSFISLSKTVGDTAEPFYLDDIPFFEANFHIQDYAVLYGDVKEARDDERLSRFLEEESKE